MYYQWQWGEYTISTNPNLLDGLAIHKFLTEQSYWAKDRTEEITYRSIEHSLCFGLYCHKEQIGFARAVTDYATFGYIMDVFVLPAYRGIGLGKWLVQCILTHPEVQDIPRWVLKTRDAHKLHARYGFTPLAKPETTMELRKTPEASAVPVEHSQHDHAQPALAALETKNPRWRRL